MNLKWLFLFLLIGLPVSIYLFLQAFGENHFVIPIFHENGPEVFIEECSGDTQGQYFAPVIFESLENRPITVYGVLNSIIDYNFKTNIESYLNSRDDKEDMSMVFVSNAEVVVPSSSFKSVIKPTSDSLNSILKCALLIDSIEMKSIFVLCDDQRRIRGYYDLSELEELDRLVTETDILIEEQK